MNQCCRQKKLLMAQYEIPKPLKKQLWQRIVSQKIKNQAACLRLFGTGFSRGSDDPRNAALNYGYAILRGGIARNLVVHGLEPCIGLFHHNELNHFNLADDLIEVNRPVVDLYMAQNFTAEDEVLTPTQKSGLFNITNYLVRHSKKRYRVMLSIDRACTTLAGSITNQALHLELPDFLSLELHHYE